MLAARIWLPEDADKQPVPAILEYLPYRKRDGTYERDALTHPYLAGHGYASVRVDLRGSGESSGLLFDEYAKQEQDDGLEVIAWLAAQPWCSGVVGMMGISWGGFNALQIAARRPPALKAIVTLCSTDDRYADDAHYMGGTLLTAGLEWGFFFFGSMCLPPDPMLVGASWRTMWLERLENVPLFFERWLRHQRRDAYWKHGSVCEDYRAIACPVYAVGGWTDAYTNAIPRLLEHLQVPRKGLIGPWAHAYPHFARPGPQIGFLQEMLRWWDYWLKGVETGVMDAPMLRAWLADSVKPAAHHEVLPGRWVAEPAWPPPGQTLRRLFLTDAGLRNDPEPLSVRALGSAQTVGRCSGDWVPFGRGADQAGDQREDDLRSLLFETQPLESRIELLGAAIVTLELASDRPIANLAVRLCDVHPSGESLRISYGVLNLAHRDGSSAPSPLIPGKEYDVRIALDDIACSIPAGYKLRVAVSNAYWPMFWPSSDSETLRVKARGSSLELPEFSGPTVDMPDSVIPKKGTPPTEKVREGAYTTTVTREGSREITTVVDDSGAGRDQTGMISEGKNVQIYSIDPSDPLSARAECTWSTRFSRGSWETSVEAHTIQTCTATHFLVSSSLIMKHGESTVLERKWQHAIPRRLV